MSTVADSYPRRSTATPVPSVVLLPTIGRIEDTVLIFAPRSWLTDPPTPAGCAMSRLLSRPRGGPRCARSARGAFEGERIWSAGGWGLRSLSDPRRRLLPYAETVCPRNALAPSPSP